ncbi:hypothetical protein J5S49_13460 [Virgibacillus halodenitrificans]|uniref:hypothetical protein n=1 Tax=Virgibacillus halodenitrificans TaxID=1482 RepID=UPI001F2EADEA|nr:hypothetical protein [Virgibacillus halodenitrificans]MCG1029299.1 hypothetical protein [Virgibacillus halodenitrificans]
MIGLCDNCGKITDVIFQEKEHPNEIKETYFKCEHCNKHTTCFVTDKQARTMQEDLKGMRKVETDSTKLEQYQDKINQRMEVLKRGIQT